MCPRGLCRGGKSQNEEKSRRFGVDLPCRAFYEGVNPKTILNNCQQRSQKGQQSPQDHRQGQQGPPAKVTERPAKATGPPAKDQQRPQTNSQGLRRDRQKTSRGQQRPTDRREDGLVLLRKKFEVQQALFEVGAADADADFVTEAVDLVGAAAAQAVFLLFKLEEIRLYVTE